MTDPILYRDADAGDVGFILSSWLKSAGDAWADSLRNTTIRDWSKLTDARVGWFADVPHRFTRQAVAEILDRATTRALVACDPEDPTVIYGYAVAEPANRIAHWRRAWRASSCQSGDCGNGPMCLPSCSRCCGK